MAAEYHQGEEVVHSRDDARNSEVALVVGRMDFHTEEEAVPGGEGEDDVLDDEGDVETMVVEVVYHMDPVRNQDVVDRDSDGTQVDRLSTLVVHAEQELLMVVVVMSCNGSDQELRIVTKTEAVMMEAVMTEVDLQIHELKLAEKMVDPVDTHVQDREVDNQDNLLDHLDILELGMACEGNLCVVGLLFRKDHVDHIQEQFSSLDHYHNHFQGICLDHCILVVDDPSLAVAPFSLTVGVEEHLLHVTAVEDHGWGDEVETLYPGYESCSDSKVDTIHEKKNDEENEEKIQLVSTVSHLKGMDPPLDSFRKDHDVLVTAVTVVPFLMTEQVAPFLMTEQVAPSLMTEQVAPSLMTEQVVAAEGDGHEVEDQRTDCNHVAVVHVHGDLAVALFQVLEKRMLSGLKEPIVAFEKTAQEVDPVGEGDVLVPVATSVHWSVQQR